MGIYTLLMGNGIILPLAKIAEIYDIGDVDNYGPFEHAERFEEAIRKQTSIDFRVIELSHDAFKFRHGFCNTDLFEGSESHWSTLSKLKLLDRKPHDEDLFFIGYAEDIPCGGEFGYYVKAPEVIYGLSALLPGIVELYPRLLATDCSELEHLFEQKSSVWTFTNDCGCCG